MCPERVGRVGGSSCRELSGEPGKVLVRPRGLRRLPRRHPRPPVTNALRPRLDQVFATIKQKAPNARVAVAGYPHLFSEKLICSEAGYRDRKWVNDAVNRGNAIELSPQQRRADGHR